jgi:hypothetical protein
LKKPLIQQYDSLLLAIPYRMSRKPFQLIKQTLINSEFPQHMHVLSLPVADQPLKMNKKIKSYFIFILALIINGRIIRACLKINRYTFRLQTLHREYDELFQQAWLR